MDELAAEETAVCLSSDGAVRGLAWTGVAFAEAIVGTRLDDTCLISVPVSLQRLPQLLSPFHTSMPGTTRELLTLTQELVAFAPT